MNRFAHVVLSSRPVSWVNTAFPFAAAYYVATRQIDATFVLGVLYFLIPYNIAMYGINDVFDYESDLRNPRKGGVEGAVLDRSMHRIILWSAALTNLPFLIYFVAVGSLVSSLILVLSVFAVVAYSAPGLRFKERPFVDSVTSSIHFVSPAVYALALVSSAVSGPLIAIIIAFFVWGIGSHAFGAVQDIVADRAGGIRSIATAMGARWTVRFSFLMYVLSGILLLVSGWPGAFAAALAVLYALNTLPFWSLSDSASESANSGWKRFLVLNVVAGFLVTMLLIWYCLAVR